jgi:hypothetical protein
MSTSPHGHKCCVRVFLPSQKELLVVIVVHHSKNFDNMRKIAINEDASLQKKLIN